MSDVFNAQGESRGMIGSGSGLYTPYFQSDGLYALLAPFVKVPFIKSETTEVDIKVASANSITKIPGVTTLSGSETEIYLHRDTINLLEEISGKTIPLLSFLPDKTGFKFDGVITYSPNEVEMENAVMGTVKITPITEPKYEPNCYDIVKPTCQFASAIPSQVVLATTTGTYVQDIELKYPTGTYTAISGNVAIATASVTGKKLTITGVKEGSVIVTLESNLAGAASWKTTILVIIPKAGAPRMMAEPQAPTDSPNAPKSPTSK